MEMQLSKTDLDIIQVMHKLEEKYGSIQGIIKATEKLKVSRKCKKEKKVFLKFLRGINYSINHKNVNLQGVA